MNVSSLSPSLIPIYLLVYLQTPPYACEALYMSTPSLSLIGRIIIHIFWGEASQDRGLALNSEIHLPLLPESWDGTTTWLTHPFSKVRNRRESER